MKTLTTIITVFLLITAFGALAADKPEAHEATSSFYIRCLSMPPGGIVTLKMDSVLKEIAGINKAMMSREEVLLQSLKVAQTELESDQIIQQIMDLDMERDLAILKVQLRFAQLHDCFALESEIIAMIASMGNSELAVLP